MTSAADAEAQATLREREGQRSSCLLFAVDLAAVITAADGAVGEVWGISAAEALGRPLAEVAAGTSALVEGARQALGGEAATGQLVLDGAVWSTRFTATWQSGRIVGAVGVAFEVTGATREARHDFWFLDSVVENIPYMIFVKEARELRFFRFNRAGEELLGYGRDALIGKNDFDFFPPAQAEFFIAKDREVLERGEPVDIPEEPIHTRLKGTRILHTKKIPILDETGKAVYLLGISEDITDRKAAEEERRQLYDRLKELDVAKTEFFANVSHELRTPLALVLASTERMLGAHPTPEVRAALDLIDRNARLLARYVEDLLAIASLETGKLAPAYARVDLGALIRLGASSFEVLAADRGASLVIDVPEQLFAEVDPDQIGRIVANLLANAIKHVPEGGVVRVTLEPRGDRVVLGVADSGSGVPPELRERVFERFFRRDPARYAGTGLGLALVRELAQLHGGGACVTDASEGGALFIVELPVSAPPGTEVRSAPESIRPGATTAATSATALELARRAAAEVGPRPAAPSPAPAGTGPLVLVVEDNPDMNRFLVETLGADYRVAGALSGEQALELALAQPPDLVVTDVMMPGMGGEALVRELRARPELAQVPVMLLTAKADDALRLRLLREGAQDYVMKPFSVEELLARIANLVAMFRARRVLQEAAASQQSDLATLAVEITRKARALATALDTARVAREEAERAAGVKSDLLNLVSHELRTPLTTMRLCLAALGRASIADQSNVATALRRMDSATLRLDRMIGLLLEQARIAGGRMAALVERFDPRALAADVIDELGSQVEAKPVKLRLSAPADLCELESDPRLLRLILVNLVGNALKFTERGQVELGLGSDGTTHRFAVTDTGPGVAREQQKRIFEPFVQLGSIPHKHLPGVGLGLALVKQMVDALGGSIELASEPGAGATFTVTLPSRAAALAAVAEPGRAS